MLNKIFRLFFLTSISFFFTLILLSANSPARADEIGIKIMEREMIGSYLTDGKGITLYRYTKDEKNTSHCMEGCALNWPPFYADPAAVIEGCESSDFAIISRPDGRKQTTYKGMPLYYFKNDRYTGDIFGDGIGDVWFLVKP